MIRIEKEAYMKLIGELISLDKEIMSIEGGEKNKVLTCANRLIMAMEPYNQVGIEKVKHQSHDFVTQFDNSNNILTQNTFINQSKSNLLDILIDFRGSIHPDL